MSEKKIVIKLNYGAPKSKQHRSSAPPDYEWNYKRIAIALTIAIIFSAALSYWLSTPTPQPEVADRGTDTDIAYETLSSEKQAMLKNSRNVDDENSFLNRDSDPSPNAPNQELLIPESVETTHEKTLVTNRKIPKQDSFELDVADTAAFQQSTKIDPAASVGRQNVARAQFTWGINNHEPTGEIASPAILRPGDSVVLYFFSEFDDMNGQSLSHEWSHNGKVHSTKKFQIDENRWRVFSSKRLTSDLLGEWKVTIKDSSGEEFGQYELKVLKPKT